MLYMRENASVRLFLPESFEWMILSSGLIKSSELASILAFPSDYIKSCEYFSWERYFTHLLIDLTKETYLHYSKSKLNPAFFNSGLKAAFLRLFPSIHL